jgi:hypothetical protein
MRWRASQPQTTPADPPAQRGEPYTRAEQSPPPAGYEQASPRRSARRARSREGGASAVGALGAGVLGLARLVTLAASLIALLIVAAIVLFDVGANPANAVVNDVHEGANFFAGGFTGLIGFAGHPKRAITIDWGIAAAVFLLAGWLIAGLIARVGEGGLRFERRHRAVSTR